MPSIQNQFICDKYCERLPKDATQIKTECKEPNSNRLNKIAYSAMIQMR